MDYVVLFGHMLCFGFGLFSRSISRIVFVPVQLLLEESDQVFRSLLNVNYGPSVNGPVEKEMGAVSQLVSCDIPVAKGVLKHAIGINPILVDTKVKRVDLEVIRRDRWPIVLDPYILKSKLLQRFVWVFLEELSHQLCKLVLDGLINRIPLVDLRFSLFNTFDVLLVVVDLLIIGPESFCVGFYLFE